MIVRFFRTHQPALLFIIPFIAFLLWMPVLFHPQSSQINLVMPLYSILYPFITNYPSVSTVFAVLLITIEAFIFNALIQRYELLGKSSYMPAFIYVLFFSVNPLINFLHPIILGMLFFLPALNFLLGTYRKENAKSDLFFVGFLLAMASLVFRPFLTLLPFLFIAITVLRPFLWREWAMIALGILLPYIYVFLYCYWTDSTAHLIEKLFIYPSLSVEMRLTILQQNYLIAISIVMVGVMFLLGSKGVSNASNTVQFRNVMTVLRWLFVFGYVSMFMSTGFDYSSALIAFIPLMFLMSSYLLTARRIWLAEILLIVLIVGIVLLNLKIIPVVLT